MVTGDWSPETLNCSLTHAHYAGWYAGSNKSTPLLSVLVQFLNGPPVVMEGLKLPFYSLTPGVLGRPPFRFPSGVQLRAVREMLPGYLLITCPIHLHGLYMMMVPMLSWLQWARRCWLEMVSSQNIGRILVRFLVWKVDRLITSLPVILQHSEP